MIHVRLCLLVSLSIVIACVAPATAQPTNIIFCVGDGMGPEQVEAARLYAGANMSFENFYYQGDVTTYSANSSVTDSAAAATALATGVKVNNGVISLAIPGDSSELPTLLEYFQSAGKSTGLVTTTYMTHATPASFGAHESSRNNNSQIATDYLTQTRPNVLLGGGANGMSVAAAQSAGYTTVTDAAGLAGLDTNTETYVSGQFGTYHLPYEVDGLGSLPHLSDMTTAALDLLDNDEDGFFLMVEGGRIDHAGHSNDLARNIGETLEFSNTVTDILAWAAGRDDTLVVVTADHETGGLTVLADNGPGFLPTVSWSTGSHTSANVPVYAWGANAGLVGGTMNNTDFWGTITARPGDFDGNGSVVADDLDALAAAIRAGSTDGAYDVNGDGSVDADDLELAVTLWADTSIEQATGTIPGDFNLDGTVDLLDLNKLTANYNGAGGWTLGDGNGDGLIDLLDLNKLTANYNSTIVVPEPGTLLIVGLGAMGIIKRRRR
jgi:alkaline phosphatase